VTQRWGSCCADPMLACRRPPTEHVSGCR
jgi:hypothetical protein